MAKYRSVPERRSDMPPGIPYIIGNELAERFSFYGMNAILTIFLAQYLLDADGQLDPMSDEQAKGVFHLFKFAAYFTPLLGAVIADVFLGKYRTILTLSLLYCVGHGSLAMMDLAPHLDVHMVPFLYGGLLLIALGAGAIKPCVSAHVGDQFGSENKGLLPRIFAWFYFSINVGSATSTILTPLLLQHVGPWLAFGVPGVLMAIATFVFWMGRNKFVHVPAAGWERFKEETFSPQGRQALLNLAPLFLIFIPMFWALFDQTGSAWVLQALTMDRVLMGWRILPSQIQAANPILILILIPIFTYAIYPAINKFFPLTPLRKISIGLFIAAIAFAVSAMIEERIQEVAPEVSDATWQVVLDERPVDGTAMKGLLFAARDVEIEPAVVAAALPELGVDEEALVDEEGNPTYKPLNQSLEKQLKDAEENDRTLTYPGAAELWPTLAERAPDGYRGLRLVSRVGEHALSDEQYNALLDPMPGILWQILAYIIITAAEVMVSITSLEFAYTQAPRKMKSFVMGVYFLGVALGNLFVSAVNFFIQNDDGTTKLDGAAYYWFFTALMAVVAVLFIFFVMIYKGRTYIQGEDLTQEPEDVDEAEAEAEGIDTR